MSQNDEHKTNISGIVMFLLCLKLLRFYNVLVSITGHEINRQVVLHFRRAAA